MTPISMKNPIWDLGDPADIITVPSSRVIDPQTLQDVTVVNHVLCVFY